MTRAVVVAGLVVASCSSDPAPGDATAAATPAPATARNAPAATPAGTSPTGAATRAAPNARPPTGPTAPPHLVGTGAVTAIGDSVMLGAAPALRSAVPAIRVDAVVSRQFGVGITVVAGMHASGTLGRELVVALGTNGTVTPAQVDAMMRAAGGVARVVFVTVNVPRTWEAGDNAALRSGVSRYPNAVLADWNALSSGHPEWFAPDGYHLNASGARAYAGLIASVL